MDPKLSNLLTIKGKPYIYFLFVISIPDDRRVFKRTIRLVCGTCWVFYVLEPMLIEPGLGTSAGWCERLASDEPEACLPSPT